SLWPRARKTVCRNQRRGRLACSSTYTPQPKSPTLPLRRVSGCRSTASGQAFLVSSSSESASEAGSASSEGEDEDAEEDADDEATGVVSSSSSPASTAIESALAALRAVALRGVVV